jgi:formylglycine-generating enzyme required for sulfatase activity
LGGVQAQGDLPVQETVGRGTVETKTDTKTRVFISYSRKDMVFADKLEAALKERGFEVLIDRQEIYAFEDWWKRIEALIGRADTVVFVLSPDAVKSDVALKEVAYAASLNKRFAPIVSRRVEDCAVPEALRRLNFIFFDDPERFGDSANKLTEALRTDIRWIREHTRFGEAAREWLAAGRPHSLLLRPPTLDVAEYWMGTRPEGAPELTSEIQTFVADSRKAAQSSQRLRRIALGSIIGLMMAVILGLVGWINQSYIADQWRWWSVTRPYAAAQVWPHVLTVAQEQALKPGQSFKECAQDCPEMVVVPAGRFAMGSPMTDRKGFTDEIPQHWVTIAKPFAVSKNELTFADWDACVAGGGCNGYKPNDNGWGAGQQPVINVDVGDAQAYVAWLSLVTGRTYRLLSEAEYEYAARATTTTEYPWGDDIKLDGQVMANCDGCGSRWDSRQTAPVASFPPNKFGLYDMIGNVFEWTGDCFHKNYNSAPPDGSTWLAGNGGDCANHVIRGGAFGSTSDNLRSASRGLATNDDRVMAIGFRVARTLSSVSTKVNGIGGDGS